MNLINAFSAFQQFYFQKQHPFNYSHKSLQRMMEYFNFKTLSVISFQRYGLENHLQWLTAAKPGVIAHLQKYLNVLTTTGSVIWIGRK